MAGTGFNIAALSSGCFFSHKCGSKLEKSFCYCPKCGAPVSCVDFGKETKTEVNIKDNLNLVPRLKSFMAQRESERQSFFIRRKSKRVKTDEKEVTINVGIMNDKDTIVRGEKRPVKVLPSASAAEILRAAIKRHTDWNKKFDSRSEYLLVHKDGSEVKYIPGTDPAESFSLQRYKEECGFGYARIDLFLLPVGDIFKQLSDILQCLEDEVTSSDDDEISTLKPVEWLQNKSTHTDRTSSGIDCPTCCQVFPLKDIAEHADLCATWFVESVDQINR